MRERVSNPHSSPDSLDLSVTWVQLTSDNINDLAGALETGLQ
jgi:hypothetical protein